MATLYRFRFNEAALPEKNRIWRVLCSDYFKRFIPADATVLDLACGYGEFINNIAARKKYGVDLNADVARFLNNDVTFLNCRADAIVGLPDASVDVVFTSNFLEHLRSKEELDGVFLEALRVLKPSGRIVAMGPNIRFLADKYWDFYDHYLPLSHLSLEEGLVQAGFEVETVIAKFLPYTTRSALPKNPGLIALYLRMPLAWQILGKQFLVVGRRPHKASDNVRRMATVAASG
ncbi:MAG: class I SAM-dependent methyltransferase [Hyphomonadaceae bacterium]|nr:class I SAM-dependent methyltransferase [Hyphomonadaceae bacterium]